MYFLFGFIDKYLFILTGFADGLLFLKILGTRLGDDPKNFKVNMKSLFKKEALLLLLSFLITSCGSQKLEVLYNQRKALAIDEVAFVFPKPGNFIKNIDGLNVGWDLGFPQYYEILPGNHDIITLYKDNRQQSFSRKKYYINERGKLNFTAVPGHIYSLKTEFSPRYKHWKPSIEDITDNSLGKMLINDCISQDENGARYFHPKGK